MQTDDPILSKLLTTIRQISPAQNQSSIQSVGTPLSSAVVRDEGAARMVRTETTIVLLPMQAAFICGLCQAQCLVMEEDPGDGSPPHERLGSWVQMDMLALTPNFSHEEKGQDGLVLFARSRSKIMLTRTHPVDENPTSVLLVDVPAGLFEQIMRRHASEVGDETDD